MNKKASKQAIRNNILDKRNTLSSEYIDKSNLDIFNKVISFEKYINANVIFTYVSTAQEVDTINIIKHSLKLKKRVCVPKCMEQKGIMLPSEIKGLEDLKEGKFGILEPKEYCSFVDISEIDFIIVPCVTCDIKGNRIGYGGGYYDRFLLAANADKILLCRKELMTENIPNEKHDILIDTVITEQRIYSQV